MKQITDNTTPAIKKELLTILKDYPTKKDLDNHPTKQDLTKAFENYPTKADLKKALKDYPTKQDLDERLTASQEAFRREMDYKFETFKQEIFAKMSELYDKIFTLVDPVVKEIERRHQERTIIEGQITEVRDITGDHERRIRVLEHS
jgi:hypothetical protein